MSRYYYFLMILNLLKPSFFERVTQALPHLETLKISIRLQQEENTTNLLEFSHLSTIFLHKIHLHYSEQLLCRSRLPHLVELVIRTEQ